MAFTDAVLHGYVRPRDLGSFPWPATGAETLNGDLRGSPIPRISSTETKVG